MINKIIKYIKAKGLICFFRVLTKNLTQKIIRSLKFLIAKFTFFVNYKDYQKKYIAYKKYLINPKKIYGDQKRKKWISAYMRIYNEEEFLEATILSHINYFDEICVLYQKSKDKSEEIIKKLQKKYPNKIKVEFYNCPVTKPKTQEYLATPSYHPTSYINYWNYNLKMTNYQTVCKLDGDHLALSKNFKRTTEIIKSKEFKDVFFYFFWINLYCYKWKVMINPNDILTWIFDHWFFNLRPWREYKKWLKFETNKNLVGWLNIKSAGILYFHLKNLKSDFWISTYTNSIRNINETIQRKKSEKLISWKEFQKKYKIDIQRITGEDITKLPDPNFYLPKNNIYLKWK